MKKALVLTLAFALGLGIAAFAGPLSGSWDTTLTIAISPTTQTMSMSSFKSTLQVDYIVGGWDFGSTSTFGILGWTGQSFAAVGVLGAFTMGSDLVFAPATAAFTSWDSTGSVSIAGVAFSGEFLLTDVGSGWTFGATGGAGDLSLGANVYFNSKTTTLGLALQTDSYCFCFSSVDFDVSFPFACVDLVDVSLGFSTAGFDGVTFSVTGIAVPGIAWLTFNADLEFTVQTNTQKTFTLTPAINLGDFTCITLYYRLITEDTYQITGIDFYGLAMTYTWGGVTFSDASSFDPVKNAAITGKAAYWEAFTISSEADSCCGGGIDFSVATYFDNTSGMLFDWGETDIDFSMGLGSNFTVDAGLVVDTTGFTGLSFGFEVTW